LLEVRRDKMKKCLMVMLATIVFLSLIAGCTVGGRVSIPTYTNPVETILVDAGEQFVIQLGFDPDTGYLWYEDYDASKLELLQSTCVLCLEGEVEFVARSGYGVNLADGAFSAQFSEFRALEAGETKVTMSYKSSPTAEAVETQTFSVIIE
jgi:predicted secreted protein